MEPLLTVIEAAEFLRMSRKTVIAYVERGELEGRLIGGRWRFSPAALRRFFDAAPSQWSLREVREDRG